MFNGEIAGLGSFNTPCFAINLSFFPSVYSLLPSTAATLYNFPTEIIKVSCYFILSEQVMLVAM